ncbi:hypothetical protein [Roseimicrobium sp. ORNL1]|uniref:hypothetical protein n=1 Tax=Roseimicrobium sp. ORNL1 TaxID=2711231 RepID=UPI0013E110D7|nr:hypothetical protein [Roseimicrobium sp. ORNL1]QIF02560.1 hypothetical protein G5S37_13850 [Roseimicrobium sp. ORNL1]
MSEQARSQTAHHLHKFWKLAILAAIASMLVVIAWPYVAGTTVKTRVQRTMRENAQALAAKRSGVRTTTGQGTVVNHLKPSDQPGEVLDSLYELVVHAKDEPVESRLYYTVFGTESLGGVAHGIGLPLEKSDFSMAQWQSALDALIARKDAGKEEIREPEATLLRVLKDSRAQEKANRTLSR